MSTNGTYVNGERIPRGQPVLLAPDDHVTLLQRDNASDSRLNIGFRIVMALRKPKLEDYYTLLNDVLGAYYFISGKSLIVVEALVLCIKREIRELIKLSRLRLFDVYVDRV